MTQAETSNSGLAGVAKAAGQVEALTSGKRGLPPVHLWHPEHCGDIDIVIRADGIWMHEGSPIGRPELVRLFSTVLRHDPDGYHLVTPGEKLKIKVEDLPFRAVAVELTGDRLVFTTDVGDEAAAGLDCPIVVDTDPTTGEPAPRIRIRADLWARIARPVFYELVEMADDVDGALVVGSDGVTFTLGRIEDRPA